MLGKRTRKQQITTLSILAVAVVVLSVGFAAFSTTLNIQSQASVNPDAGNFSVKFSSDGTSVANTQTVVASSSTYGDNATIDNSLQNPTIKGLNAKFTKPGQSVSYSFYAKNTGEYLAYLSTILFNNVSGATANKVCTAGTDASGVETTEELVQAACNGINVSVKVGTDAIVTETTTVSNHTLAIDGKEPVVVTISYGSTAAVADGPFTVSFGDISLVYSSVGSSTGVGTTVAKVCDVIQGSGVDTGDRITCGTESFYVLRKNGTNIEILTEKAIGPISQGEVNTSTSLGLDIKQMDNAGSIDLDDYDQYWENNPKYDLDNWPVYIYEEQSPAYPYVSQYVSYLENTINLSVVDAQLLNYEQLQQFGCSYGWDETNTPVWECTSLPSWMEGGYYTGLIGAYGDYHYSLQIPVGSQFNNNIRPVITIPISALK